MEKISPGDGKPWVPSTEPEEEGYDNEEQKEKAEEEKKQCISSICLCKSETFIYLSLNWF